MIRILIADDHAVVRQGLRAFLELEAGVEVVGEAAEGEEAARSEGFRCVGRRLSVRTQRPAQREGRAHAEGHFDLA